MIKFEVGDRVYCDIKWEVFGYGTIIHITDTGICDVSIDRVPAGIVAKNGDIFCFSHEALTLAYHKDFLDKIEDRIN